MVDYVTDDHSNAHTPCRTQPERFSRRLGGLRWAFTAAARKEFREQRTPPPVEGVPLERELAQAQPHTARSLSWLRMAGAAAWEGDVARRWVPDFPVRWPHLAVDRGGHPRLMWRPRPGRLTTSTAGTLDVGGCRM